MDDLIRRKEAIDAICKACSLTSDYHKCDGYPEESAWCEELVALRALPSAQPTQTNADSTQCNTLDCVSRQWLMECVNEGWIKFDTDKDENRFIHLVRDIAPSAQPEDYAELKREFLRMASYIDVLLECSDEQKETLVGFISRLAEFMPWTERD